MKSLTFRTWIAAVLVALVPASRIQAAENDSKPAAKDAEGIARAVEKAVAESSRRHHGLVINTDDENARVQIGHPVVVQTNETIETVVVLFADAFIDGTVTEDVVVVGGDAIINGKVGESVVAVLGEVKLGPESNVGGDVVGVGRGVSRAQGATVGGHVEDVDLGPMGRFRVPESVGDFLRYCVLQLRPLSFKVGWVWWIAGVFLLGYVVLTVAFPRPVDAGVAALEEKPALSLLLGILAKPLVGIIALLLAITGVGVFVVPFLIAGLVVAAFFGKASVMRYLGHQFGRQLNAGPLKHPLLALLAGAAILTIFYLIPFLGFAVWAVASMWGLGAILMALGGRFRRETPAGSYATPTPAPGWAAPLAVTSSPGFTTSTQTSTTMPLDTGTTAPVAGTIPAVDPAAAAAGAAPPVGATTAPLPGAPPAPEAWSLPRVGFWRRALATLLDTILLGVITGTMRIMPAGFILWVAYYAAMWAWRGTTIGGIVVGIKVVRLDGRKMDFATALVRSLGAVFSTIVIGLGYFWAGWDRDKQGWHDKIAGTVVVRVPQAQALVMF